MLLLLQTELIDYQLMLKEECELKKIYDEPSFELTKFNFGKIMDGGDDDYELIAPSKPGGGAGGGAAGGGD